MFGLSFTHLILLAVIALVVLGPEQLPEVARTIARLLNEWKRATSDIQTSLTNTLREDLMKPNPQPPETPVHHAQDEHPPHDDHHMHDPHHHPHDDSQAQMDMFTEIPPHAGDTLTEEERQAQQDALPAGASPVNPEKKS